MIRLFAALSIPAAVGAALATRQRDLPDARWRAVEAFHITLRFFGEIAENKADDLDLELSQVRGRPLQLELRGVGAFGEGDDIHARSGRAWRPIATLTVSRADARPPPAAPG
jgi:2'-5' RNA ligase